MTETETNAPSPKADRATLSRELSNFLIEFSIALNKHGMYPLGHPALEPTAGAVQRRLELLLTTDDTLSLGVARKQLVIEGVATDPSSPVLAELAAKLHRHHLGAVTFQSGTTAEEIREVLQLIALEPDRMDDPLGLGAPERLTQWLHIVLHPVNYGRLELLVDGEGDEEERERSAARVRASQLWIGLAQAAIAAEEARDEESVGYEIDHDPSAVAKAINDRPRTSAYDQVIVGYLLQMGEELRAGQGEEDAELRKRMSKLIADLDSTTLQGLLSMGGDHTQRRNFLLNATQGLAAEVVVELVKAAGEAEEQTVSHSLLRVLQKLAQHAEQGEGRRRAEADLALREQVRALISDWALRDPNPEGYRLTLSRVAEAKSVFAAYTDTRYAPEPRRIIEMALEADVMGEAVAAAANALVEQGELKWLLQTLETSGTVEVPRAIWDLLCTPEILEPLLEAERVDTGLLDLIIPHATPEAAETLLDMLAESDSSRTRQIILERLSTFGHGIGDRASARLTDSRWYVRRNMLKLISELDEMPEDVGPEEYMKDPDERVRLEALRILLQQEEAREQVLGLALGDSDDRVAMTGLRTTLTKCPESLIPRIAAIAVSRRSNDVRMLAVRVLAGTGHKIALEALLKLTAARRGLFGSKGPAKTPVYLAVLRALHSFEDDVRAQRALEKASRSRDAEIAGAAAGPSAREQ